MKRTKIPAVAQKSILLSCRRRCCICFGLNRDSGCKNGQIAHLDKNNTNNNEDNLAFLCLEHHDEYDSTTSQRKNFNITEVKAFRDELVTKLADAFSIPVKFGYVSLPQEDPFAGRYTRNGSGANTAELVLIPLRTDIEGRMRYFIDGIAVWGAERESGPNIGELAIVGIMNDEGELDYHGQGGGQSHHVLIRLSKDNLIFEEAGEIGVYENAVTFTGEYTLR